MSEYSGNINSTVAGVPKPSTQPPHINNSSSSVGNGDGSGTERRSSNLFRNPYHPEIMESAMDLTTQEGPNNHPVVPIQHRPSVFGMGSGRSQDQFNISEINSNNNNTSNTYKRTSEVVKIIPEFNGRNISVNQFIRECRDAEHFINPNDRKFFVKLVKSRVTGDAQAYLQFKTFSNLEQLLEELKRTFTSAQNLPQLQTELSRLVQKPTEKVSEYGREQRSSSSRLEGINEDFEADIIPGMTQGTMATAITNFQLGFQKDMNRSSY